MRDVVMEIIIVRHGIAVDIGENGVTSDDGRMLSEEGRVRTREAGLGLKALGCSPEVILSSPLRRAVETAEILRKALGGGAKSQTVDALLFGADVRDGVAAIAATRCATVMVVGHMPHLSCLASYLLAGNENVAIPFKKAAACSLLCEGAILPGAAVLQWMLPPGVLRKL